MNPIQRGIKNIWRNRTRSASVIFLLGLIMALILGLVEVNNASKKELSEIESRAQTVIEIRPAGMSGASYSENKATANNTLSTETVGKIKRIPRADTIVKVEEYIYRTQIDTTRSNPFSILIGMQPESEMRVMGEIDSEHAKIIAGQSFTKEDGDKKVVIVGRLYAKQRLGLRDADIQAYKTNEKSTEINGENFTVKGIYETGNDLSENHAFIPISSFRQLFNPGNRLSKIFVTVDSVKNVEAVAEELKIIKEADIVTSPGAVSAVSQYVTTVAKVSGYTFILAVIAGVALVTFTMMLSLKERVREVGVIKALGGSNLEVIAQFIGESVGMTVIGAIISSALYIIGSQTFVSVMGIPLQIHVGTFLTLFLISLLFGGIGSAYPIVRGINISPVEAIKKI